MSMRPLPLCSAFPAFLFSFSILPPYRVHQHAPKPIHKPVLHRILVLSSLNTVTKEMAIVAMILGRTSPHPGLGPQVELSGRHASSLFDFLGIGKTLPSE